MNCFGCRKTGRQSRKNPGGAQIAHPAPAARKARGAFPFAESNLDAVKMRLFLDKELGDRSYRLEVRIPVS